MTTYSVSQAAQSVSGGVLASSVNGTKISRIDILNPSANSVVAISVYTGAAFSGGTALTPFPMRAGAPAASATCKFGATTSGAQKFLSSPLVQVSGQVSFQPAFDLILAAGSAVVASIAGGATAQFVFYFEELRLAWSV